MYHAPRRSAFTLIELLVVMSLVALLIALLLPALAKARQVTHATASLSNVRQVTLGIHYYAHDNDTSLPFDTWNFENANARTWASELYKGAYVPNPAVYWSPPRKPWGGASGLASANNWWICPGYGANNYGAMPNKNVGTSSSYSANPVKPLRLGHPARRDFGATLLLAETFRPSMLPPNSDGRYDGRYDLLGATAGLYTFDERVVTSYVDGHGVMVEAIDLLWDVNLPGNGRGFGPYRGAWTSTAASARAVPPYYRR